MCEWPCRLLLGYPYAASSRVKFQTMRVLSRDPDRSMFGLHVNCQPNDFRQFLPSAELQSILMFANTYFSREVAREVTQPVWPSRVPRRTNCSAILCGGLVTLGISWVGGVLRIWRMLLRELENSLNELCGRLPNRVWRACPNNLILYGDITNDKVWVPFIVATVCIFV